jgi:hypothetical protein
MSSSQSSLDHRFSGTAHVHRGSLLGDLHEIFGDPSWEDEVVTCFARRHTNSWTVVYPEFSTIRVSGSSLHEAVGAAAVELVMLIIDEGHRGESFSLRDLRQPLEGRKRVKWELGLFVSRALNVIHEDSWLDVKSLRMPLLHAVCTAEAIVESDRPTVGGDEDDGDDGDEAALMAEGYRELATELHRLAEEALPAVAEVWPDS